MIGRPHLRALLGATIFVVVTTLLAMGHRRVGYVRDEGIYFEASRDYARWVDEVVADPTRLGDRKLRDRRFVTNHEHPALMKVLAGVTAGGLGAAERSDVNMPEGAAMRLPAQILAGLGAALLFLAASRRTGIMGGLLAAGFVFTLPHVWFHAGLHAFDVPVMVATLAVALAYLRALRSARWSVALGVLLGVAIAIKHNALFVAPLLTLHLAGVVARGPSRSGWRALTRVFSLPVVSMVVVAPLVAYALWPWLWNAPIPRLRAYFEFHAQHNWYNMEFLGVNYNQPPMPFAYPWVMTWATVPTALLVLALLGLGWRRRLTADEPTPRRSPGGFMAPLGDADPRERWLWIMLGLAPLLLIAWPTTPIFGGTKHWLTAYPFLALAAAQAWHSLWEAVASPRRRILEPLALALVLAPSTWSTVRGHPWNLSQYAPLVGGARGAAEMGLNRGFWGHAVLPLLPRLGRHDGPLCLGDLHPLVQRQYAREGRWPSEVDTAALPRCRSGLHFYELHMLTYELAFWNQFGSAAPRELVELDDVPLSSLYGPLD